MNSDTIDLRRGIGAGIVAGMIWGVISLITASITRVFEFDHGIAFDIPIFIAGGAGYGLIVGAFMEVVNDKLPFAGSINKAIFISVSIWLLFFIIGILLHFTMPDRYTIELPQHVQGFILSFVFGLLLGVIWRRMESI